jgi:hypothetical protein
MPLTFGVEDVPSSQLEVQMTTKTWEPKINPLIIGGEVHDAQ